MFCINPKLSELFESVINELLSNIYFPAYCIKIMSSIHLKKQKVPVIEFFPVDVETVILRESLVSVPVGQLHTEGILLLIGQNVHKLISQPVFSRHTPKALEKRVDSGSVYVSTLVTRGLG